tara:strand:+ start:218 stop:535 length:318 start_codon:yes stop_codon:yes gene_type:complete
MQSIRSLEELILISKSRNKSNKVSKPNDFNILAEDSGQRKRYIRSQYAKIINLPNLPKISRNKWKRSKDALSKLFNELDYNTQIQSSYDITLLERQCKINRRDVA